MLELKGDDMNWIYDHTTECSRLMVGYDRWGITIRTWTDDFEGEKRYHVHEGFYTWDSWRKRERSYSGDNGKGRMKDRIVAGAISLMGDKGPSSDSCGEVDRLDEYVNGGHVFNC